MARCPSGETSSSDDNYEGSDSGQTHHYGHDLSLSTGVSQVSYSGQQTTTVRNSSGDLVTTGLEWWGNNHSGTADYSETYTDTLHEWVTQPTYTYDHSWVIDSGSTTHDEYAGHEEWTVTYEGGTSSSDYCSGGDANGSKHDWYQLTGHWTEGNWVPASGSGSGYWEYASGDDSSASNFSDYDSYDVPGSRIKGFPRCGRSRSWNGSICAAPLRRRRG